MSLFGDLPPPKRAQTKPESNLDNEYKPRAVAPEDLHHEEERAASPEDGTEDERPDLKRRKVESSNDAGGAGGGLSGPDQVSAALVKIGGHISNPDKFVKAAGLLRQLIDGSAAGRQHRELLFEVVKAAFSDLDAASDPGLRRDYMRLCHSLDKRQAAEPGLFSRAQRAQLEVYRVLGFTQNEMHTDDSFVFNKVLSRIKEAVEALPPADEADEEAQAELQAAGDDSDSDHDAEAEEAGGGGKSRPRVEQDQAQERAQEEEQEGPAGAGGSGEAPAAAGPAAAGPQLPQEQAAQEEPGAGAGVGDEDVEADPFGLDSLLPAPKKKQAPPAPPPPPPPAAAQAPAAAARGGQGEAGAGEREGRAKVWSAAQCLVMRRQAYIECLITAKSMHKLQWARTSVELLVEHFNQRRDRFTGQQQLAIDEMVRFVRDSRKARASGPSVKELNRDTTSFERARSEWSRAKVSARGKVGAQGDAKANNWLG
ncbi:hypothetical protein HXX76_006678 [Chlamydomonas incerta]|uniref:Uncharacterized protein n=1 Tax=Chlamydomonas incerta TaxID=51695 RepID=A0A835TDS2_CHLIN|nr:hypothetical protein HXX76_006678 [Chlamydomonas incerta]|eukprot:KAG2436371.1 hypothetical protein HXX76_006678 [Chlamydomonas incerta]